MYTGKEVLTGWLCSAILLITFPILGIASFLATVYATCVWIKDSI